MKIGSGLRLIFILGALGLAGCAAAPTGPKFGEMVLPQPPQDKAMMVVYRDYAEPSALAAKIDVDGTQVFELPQKAFAHAIVEPGKHALALRWPAASGTPGWKDDAEWQPGQTYYYQLRGTSGHGWYFKSGLDVTDASLARTQMTDCCRLITELKSTATLATSSQEQPRGQRTINLANIKQEMLPEEVIAAIGAPDHVSSESTGKKGIPFYFGSDTRRVSWSYARVGYVVFSRNEYTGTLRVVETKADTNAP
jgi:hypothetical protein